jgi:hypothetical protein
MAGRNVAPDLSGMFQMINQPLSEMGNAGNQYIDTFRRSMAPRVDMDDSASLLRYADWARRNGYEDEARQYMALGYRQKEKETELAKQAAQANIMADVARRTRGTQSLAGAGDTRALTLNKEALMKDLERARASGDRDAVKLVVDQIKSIDTAMPTATSAKAKKGAAAIDQYQAMLDGNDLDATQKANLQRALDYLKSDPEVMSAYQAIKKDQLAVRQAEGNVAITESAVAQIPVDNALKELQLSSAQIKLLADQYAAEDKLAKVQGADVAKSLTTQGIYAPSALPKDLDPRVRAHAVDYLNSEANAQKQAAETPKGSLTDFNYNRAQGLAKTNEPFRKLLNEYDRVTAKDTLEPTEAIRVTAQITKELAQYDARVFAQLGSKSSEAAGQLATLRELPDTSGLFEGDTYKEALEDQALFNEMSKGLAEYMLNNGIETFENYAQLYAAMDAVAPTLPSQDEWRKVTNKVERERDQAQQAFDRRFESARNDAVKQFSDEIVALEPAWADYPDDLKAEAEAKFQQEVDNVTEFFNPQKWQGGVTRDPQTGKPFTPQMSMIFRNSDEWASVVEMVGEEWAGKIKARAEAGFPVRLEDFNWGDKK